MIKNGFERKYKKRRLELNLTLDEVSTKLSVSKPTIQRYESGVISNIPSSKIERLASILETTPSSLMGWVEKNIEEAPILTEEEQSLLDKFNSLDYLGKHTVKTILEVEFNRCK